MMPDGPWHQIEGTRMGARRTNEHFSVMFRTSQTLLESKSKTAVRNSIWRGASPVGGHQGAQKSGRERPGAPNWVQRATKLVGAGGAPERTHYRA